MITNLAYIEMRVRDFDECVDVYGRTLGLTELQNTTAVLTEKGEWVSTASSEAGDREAIFQVGDSFLILHEDADALTQILPNGDLIPGGQVPGAVTHLSFYVDGNHHAFSHWKGFFDGYRYALTKAGPAVQPMNHSYLQRSLLEFADPNGYTIQVSEIVDPRSSKQGRRQEKVERASRCTGGLIKGFDHLNMRCSDIDFTRELYADKLDLSVVDHSESDQHEGYVFAAGLCDLELGASKAGVDPELLGPGVVGSMGLWCDDLDSLISRIGHTGAPAERDLALGVPVRSITLDSGDGFVIELAQPL